MATLGNPVSTQTLMSNINVYQVAVQNVPGTTETALATGSYSQASSTALANVTGLSITVPAGTYLFNMYLSTTNNGTGGLTLKFSNTGATVTSFVCDTWVYNTTTVSGQVNVTALTSNLVDAAIAATAVESQGVLVLSVGGTLQLQAAQHVSNGTALTIANNSFISFTRVV